MVNSKKRDNFAPANGKERRRELQQEKRKSSAAFNSNPVGTHTNQLPCGVMVARRILVPPVRVRILPRQHKERAKSVDLALFLIPDVS